MDKWNKLSYREKSQLMREGIKSGYSLNDIKNIYAEGGNLGRTPVQMTPQLPKRSNETFVLGNNEYPVIYPYDDPNQPTLIPGWYGRDLTSYLNSNVTPQVPQYQPSYQTADSLVPIGFEDTPLAHVGTLGEAEVTAPRLKQTDSSILNTKYGNQEVRRYANAVDRGQLKLSDIKDRQFQNAVRFYPIHETWKQHMNENAKDVASRIALATSPISGPAVAKAVSSGLGAASGVLGPLAKSYLNPVYQATLGKVLPPIGRALSTPIVTNAMGRAATLAGVPLTVGNAGTALAAAYGLGQVPNVNNNSYEPSLGEYFIPGYGETLFVNDITNDIQNSNYGNLGLTAALMSLPFGIGKAGKTGVGKRLGEAFNEARAKIGEKTFNGIPLKYYADAVSDKRRVKRRDSLLKEYINNEKSANDIFKDKHFHDRYTLLNKGSERARKAARNASYDLNDYSEISSSITGNSNDYPYTFVNPISGKTTSGSFNKRGSKSTIRTLEPSIHEDIYGNYSFHLSEMTEETAASRIIQKVENPELAAATTEYLNDVTNLLGDMSDKVAFSGSTVLSAHTGISVPNDMEFFATRDQVKGLVNKIGGNSSSINPTMRNPNVSKVTGRSPNMIGNSYDIEIIETTNNNMNGAAIGQNAHQIYRALHPKEYRKFMSANRDVTNLHTLELPCTGEQLIKELQDPVNALKMQISNALDSSQPKHVERISSLLTSRDPFIQKTIREQIIARGEQSVDGYKNVVEAYPLLKFDDVSANKEFLQKLEYPEDIADDPEAMRNICEKIHMDLLHGRNFDLTHGNSYKGATINFGFTDFAGSGGNYVMGSSGGPSYGLYNSMVQRNFNESSVKTPIDLFNLNIKVTRGSGKFTPSEVNEMNKFFNQYGKNFTGDSASDLDNTLRILQQSYLLQNSQPDVVAQIMDDFAKQFNIPMLIGDMYAGPNPYIGGLSKTDTYGLSPQHYTDFLGTGSSEIWHGKAKNFNSKTSYDKRQFKDFDDLKREFKDTSIFDDFEKKRKLHLALENKKMDLLNTHNAEYVAAKKKSAASLKEYDEYGNTIKKAKDVIKTAEKDLLYGTGTAGIIGSFGQYLYHDTKYGSFSKENMSLTGEPITGQEAGIIHNAVVHDDPYNEKTKEVLKKHGYTKEIIEELKNIFYGGKPEANWEDLNDIQKKAYSTLGVLDEAGFSKFYSKFDTTSENNEKPKNEKSKTNSSFEL